MILLATNVARISPLVIASHNEGKVKEIRELLEPFKIHVISAAILGLPEPEENGDSFVENAIIKSASAAELTGNYALADDSGLCIPALDGAPGIYSARWAGPEKSFVVAIERIQKELKEKNIDPVGVAAYFLCVLSLTSPEGVSKTFEGQVHGTLTFPPRGSKGFGYDPIFVPASYNQTFAQIEPLAKHAISHRALAFEKFLSFIEAS